MINLQSIKNSLSRLSIILLISIFSLNVSAFEYSISKQEIQKSVDKAMPIQKNIMIGKLEMQKGTVGLLPKQDALIIDIQFSVDLFEKLYQGTAQVQSGVSYDSESGTFYLKELKMNAFDIDKLSPDLIKQIKNIVKNSLNSSVGKEQLAKNAIYTIGNENVKEKLLKATLKGLEIRKNEVALILSPL